VCLVEAAADVGGKDVENRGAVVGGGSSGREEEEEEEEEEEVGGVEGGKVGRWKMGFLAERVGMAIGICYLQLGDYGLGNPLNFYSQGRSPFIHLYIQYQNHKTPSQHIPESNRKKKQSSATRAVSQTPNPQTQSANIPCEQMPSTPIPGPPPVKKGCPGGD